MNDVKDGDVKKPKRGKGKIGLTAKDNILAVFNRLGGTASMAKWAKDNQTEFYKLYARLIPAQIAGKVEHEHTHLDIGHAESLTLRGLERRTESTEHTVQ